MLRRMTEALRDQNWTTILVEFVLLVCGVFFGIEAANWNATQQEHALENEYIARLQHDFAVIDASGFDEGGPKLEVAATNIEGNGLTFQILRLHDVVFFERENSDR